MEKFSPSFESLRTYACPQWIQDAKFGIWSHWGPQSVPMAGDWYARNMYIQGTPQYNYHVRHYGHPSQFGYKDICKLWKAEKFNPEELMDLYWNAGARYFVAQAMHHDNFFNYNSAVNPMNSAQVGPMCDICAAWEKAARAKGMRFGLTEHLGASFSWWRTNKGADKTGPMKDVPYDGNDPAWRNFYHDNYEHLQDEGFIDKWYTQNSAFHDYWLRAMKELVDTFSPDLLYTDGGLPFGHAGMFGDGATGKPDDALYAPGLQAVAHLYNSSIQKHGQNEAVYLQKDRREPFYPIGVLDMEKSQLAEASPKVWHTDTCIGNWFYDAQQTYKSPALIIELLVDIVSKNGVMLLNVLQRPDGTIDEEARWILQEMGTWFSVCGEGIYGTRPFRVCGEGEAQPVIENFVEQKTPYTAADWRFTAKENTLYAFLMAAPKTNVAVLKTLREDEAVKKVTLLGVGDMPFTQAYGTLCIQLPEHLPTQYVNCFAIAL